MSLISLAEAGWLPDAVIRLGIRRLLRKRMQQTREERANLNRFVENLKQSPLAVHTQAANDQHYETPAEFFEQVLGPRLKYSCCHYDTPEATLPEAEESMLRLTCQRAGLAEGQRILELGCGWGSLTLWMAEQYPGAQVTAVSNSHSQRRFIEARAVTRGLTNLKVLTADMVNFAPPGEYDRIVSVEMFEHMRNYELLFQRVAGWLASGGEAFVHVFCHAEEPYLFESEGKDNWMGRHFFTGGVMPSEDLFDQFSKDLGIVERWRVDGTHYWRTCEHWLQNLDQRLPAIRHGFERTLPPAEARVAVQRWRMFFLACAELFRYEGGMRWFVAHYRFQPVAPLKPRENGRSPVDRPAEPADGVVQTSR